MPSETPGSSQELVPIAPACVACGRLQTPRPPDFPFGATYRIQRLTLHLATSLPVRLLLVSLGVEFPSATLSIVARVPSYPLAPCVLPLPIQVVDYSFPGALRTLLT